MYGIGSYSRERHGSILLARMQAERRLLADPDRQLNHALYVTDRYTLYEPVHDEIKRRLKKGKSARVLEIGGGEGFVPYSLARNLKPANNLEFTMTSLTPMPEHAKVRAEGVRVFTGVLAERLPVHWQDQFDIVATDSVVGWTDIPKTLSEIRRVLASGGVWIGLESVVALNKDRTSTVKKDIQKQMKNLNMKNHSGWWTQFMWWQDGDDVFQFTYKKELSET